MFTLKNTTQDVTFWWWFNRTSSASVFTLAFFAFVSGGLIRAPAQHDVENRPPDPRAPAPRPRSTHPERELADMKSKAAMLKTRSPTATAPTTPPVTTEHSEHGIGGTDG